MSIKIYDGYSLPIMSLKELFNLLETFGNNARKLAKKLAKKRLAEDASYYFDKNLLISAGEVPNAIICDDYILKKLNKNSSPFQIAREVMTEAHQQLSSSFPYRDPLYDFSFSVCFNYAETQILCIIYYEQREFEKLWKKVKHVKEYLYYNNTDRPSYLSQEQWDERQRMWDIALPGGKPSHSGLSFEPVNNYDVNFIMPKEISLSLPSIKKRAKNWADEILSNKFFSEREVSVNTIGSIFHEFNNWKKNDGKQEVIKTEKYLESMLPKLTVDLLLKEIPLT